MNISDFNYKLDKKLIAKYPIDKRSDSRLLVLNKKSGEIWHKKFTNILNYINSNDLIVFNNTKVIPARLYGKKITGGKIEILIERILSKDRVLTHIKASKSPQEGSLIFIEQEAFKVESRKDDLFVLKLVSSKRYVLDIINQYGHMPLPPYIDRQDEALDKDRYQSVFARHEGAVAAPTASLHFDNELIDKIAEKNIQTAFVTLHVGAGTFQPVRVDNILDHKMHSEFVYVSDNVCEQIRQTKRCGGKIIAVGTTVVRSLETASLKCSDMEIIKKFYGDSKLFIYPGFKFKCVDMMITNFHLPKSTLLMLISAFAGSENIKKSYKEAILNKYRFFSYGDAMLII